MAKKDLFKNISENTGPCNFVSNDGTNKAHNGHCGL